MARRPSERPAPFITHEVANQVPPLADRNLFEDNVALVEALEREGGGWARERAREVGAAWGGDPIGWGFEANENPPRLKAFDRCGRRIDEVEFHGLTSNAAQQARVTSRPGCRRSGGAPTCGG